MMKKVFPILALSMFSSNLGMALISPLLPLYIQNMGATGVWLGVVFAAYAASNSIANPYFGGLSDRQGRKLILCVGLLVYGVSSLGYIWATNIPHLLLVRLIQGVAMAMTMPIAQAYVGDLSPKGEEGKWMGYTQAAFFSGMGVGPLLGGWMSDHFGMNTAFFFMGALNILAFLFTIIFLPDVKPGKLLTKPHIAFKEMSASGMMKGLFGFRLMLVLGRGAMMVFLPIFATSELNLSQTLIGVALTANFLLMTVFAIPVGWLADRFDKRLLLVVGTLVTLVGMAMIPLSKGFGLLLILSIVQGLGFAVAMPVTAALSVEEGRKFGMGSTMGVLTLAMSIGMALGPIVSGAVNDAFGISWVFYFGAILGAVGVYLFVWFSRTRSPRGVEPAPEG